MASEKYIDLQLIKPLSKGSGVKGKISLTNLFKEYFDKLNVGYLDTCCPEGSPGAFGCPAISDDADNIIECRPDGLYATGGGGTSLTIGATVVDGTQGSVLFLGAGGVLAQDNANLFFNDTTNNLGIQTNTPTAKLHLGAGSTAANTAPIKLTSGALMTTPEAGAIEFLTDLAYLTITTGTARKAIATFDGTPASRAIQMRTAAGTRLSDSILTQNGPGNEIFNTGRYLGEYFSALNNTAAPTIITTYASTGITAGSNFSFTNTGANLFLNFAKISSGTGTTPTARLYLAPNSSGAAASAPLKFVTGVNMATPEEGAVEYNGTNLFFTRTGTTRETVFTGVSGATAPTTTTAAVVTTDYYGSNTAVLTTPNSWASVVIAGTTYKIPLYL